MCRPQRLRKAYRLVPLVTEKNSKTTNFGMLHDVYPRNHKIKISIFHCLRSHEQSTSYPIMGCTIIPLGFATSDEIKTF